MQTEMNKYFSIISILILWTSASGPIANASEVHDAARSGNIEKLERILAPTNGWFSQFNNYLGGESVNSSDDDGNTPMHLAAREGHESIVDLLVNKGADVNVNNDNNYTPLHLAAIEGHESVVSLLVKKGADVNIQTKDWQTPLHLAARHGYIKIVKILTLNGSDLDATQRYRHDDERKKKGFLSGEQYTPLLYAVEGGYVEVAEYLTENGANLSVLDSNGSTALHVAAFSDDSSKFVKMAKFLIQSGLDINATDNSLRTPLHIAATQGSQKLALLFIKSGANIFVCDVRGDQPWHLTNVSALKTSLYSEGMSDNVSTCKDGRVLRPHFYSEDEKHKEISDEFFSTDTDIGLREFPRSVTVRIGTTYNRVSRLRSIEERKVETDEEDFVIKDAHEWFPELKTTWQGHPIELYHRLWIDNGTGVDITVVNSKYDKEVIIPKDTIMSFRVPARIVSFLVKSGGDSELIRLRIDGEYYNKFGSGAYLGRIDNVYNIGKNNRYIIEYQGYSD